MKKDIQLRTLAAAALVFALVLHVVPNEASGAERVKLALPSKSMGYLPLFVAMHRGFFKDEGIDLEIVMMLPDIAHNALFQGEIDYHTEWPIPRFAWAPRARRSRRSSSAPRSPVMYLRQSRRLDVCWPLKGAYSQTLKNQNKNQHDLQLQVLWPNLKSILPELSNSGSPPAEPGVYPRLIIF